MLGSFHLNIISKDFSAKRLSTITVCTKLMQRTIVLKNVVPLLKLNTEGNPYWSIIKSKYICGILCISPHSRRSMLHTYSWRETDSWIHIHPKGVTEPLHYLKSSKASGPENLPFLLPEEVTCRYLQRWSHSPISLTCKFRTYNILLYYWTLGLPLHASFNKTTTWIPAM